MKVSLKSDYALRVLLELSKGAKGKMFSVEEISRKHKIPKKYLEQILILLRNAGYIATKRGPGGGIWLIKDPNKVSVGEIIRLMDGSTSPIICVDETKNIRCSEELRCVFKALWGKVKKAVDKIVDNTTIAELKP